MRKTDGGSWNNDWLDSLSHPENPDMLKEKKWIHTAGSENATVAIDDD